MTQKTIEYHLVFDYFPKTLQNVIDKLIDNEELFPLYKLLRFTKSLINTLAYLQTLKVCHRDLKPENLLVDKKVKNVFVIDFGESKQVLNYNTTVLKTLVGTPNYLSPELFTILEAGKGKKLKEINFFKSDVFSFGLVILNLGTLEKPKRNNDEETYSKNIEKNIKKLGKNYRKKAKDEGLEKELDDLIDILTACLTVDHRERPDFIKLYFKMMERCGEDKFEEVKDEIRNLILMSENEKE